MIQRLPLCYVLMLFGKKHGLGGALIDFDAVFRDLSAPAVEQAGLKPLRADEKQAGGVIRQAAARRREGGRPGGYLPGTATVHRLS